MKSKDDIRHDVRVRRAGLTLAWIDVRSKAAVEQLKGLDALKAARHLACYLAKPFEIQTQRFIESCVSAGKRVCVPRCQDEEPGYAWSWVAPGAAWRDGPWHIAEPAQFDPVDPSNIELAVVPAVAVDPMGHRVGHGGRNFDRLLSGLTCTRVALVFDFQVLDEVPTEGHDIAVNMIVTESRIHTVQG